MQGAQHVVVALGNEEYALPVDQVREITRLSGVKPIPDAPAYVQGLINLRGQAIPLISLHLCFGTQRYYNNPDVLGKSTYALITEFKGELVALSVDEVREVRQIDEVMEPPRMVQVPYICGIINLSDRIIMKIDLPQMLKDIGLESINGATGEAVVGE